MPITLARALAHAEVDDAQLKKKFKPIAGMVEELLGLHPNADRTLAIWPPGLRTYQLLVPNLMNLPHALFKGREWKCLMGLSMYYASKAADCRYCTAHTCTLVLRRGGSIDSLKGNLSPKEKAVADLAQGMATIPSSLTPEVVREAEKYFSKSKLEWLVYAAALMGFLNKVMETLGVELEKEAFWDVGRILSEMGWEAGIHTSEKAEIPDHQPKSTSDNWSTYVKIFRSGPGAIRLESQWTKGIPADTQKAKALLEQQTGYAFPFLDYIKPKRITKALTTVLRDHLDKKQSSLPLYLKYLSGIIYATVVQNNSLGRDCRELLRHSSPSVDDQTIMELKEIAQHAIPVTEEEIRSALNQLAKLTEGNEKEAAVLLLAKASSNTPSNLSAEMIRMATNYLSPAQIIEIVTWMGVLQFFQRAGSYLALMKEN